MKTIREKEVGKATVRLIQTADGYVGVVLQAGRLASP
jgi:hypothetical protein